MCRWVEKFWNYPRRKVFFVFVGNKVSPLKLFTRCVGDFCKRSQNFSLQTVSWILWSLCRSIKKLKCMCPTREIPFSFPQRIRPKLKQSSWLCGYNNLSCTFLFFIYCHCVFCLAISLCHNFVCFMSIHSFPFKERHI